MPGKNDVTILQHLKNQNKNSELFCQRQSGTRKWAQKKPKQNTGLEHSISTHNRKVLKLKFFNMLQIQVNLSLFLLIIKAVYFSIHNLFSFRSFRQTEYTSHPLSEAPCFFTVLEHELWASSSPQTCINSPPVLLCLFVPHGQEAQFCLCHWANSESCSLQCKIFRTTLAQQNIPKWLNWQNTN